MTLYCPACWKEIGEEDRTCPQCGTIITEHEAKSFDEKLIQALRNPVLGAAGMAVRTLGQRKIVEAVVPLMKLFEMTDNPFLQRDVLDALDKIGTEDALNFIMEALEHPVGMVRRRAWEIMNERETRRE